MLVSAAQASEAELTRLKSVIDGAIDAIYADPAASSSQKQAQVRSVIEKEYDLNVIIRRAIGRNWNLMSGAEQEEVLKLVKQLVVKAYVEGMNGKSRPGVSFGEIVTISDKRMEIPCAIRMDEQTINVLYRLGRMRTGWQIYDIVAEDISVVSNYRDQIDDHFRRGSGAELIEKLRELLTKEDLNEEITL